MGGITKIIETPLGAVLMLVITLVLASLTVATAISGQLTAENRRNPLHLLNCCFRNGIGQTYPLDIGWFVRNCLDYSYGEPFWKGIDQPNNFAFGI